MENSFCDLHLSDKTPYLVLRYPMKGNIGFRE